MSETRRKFADWLLTLWHEQADKLLRDGQRRQALERYRQVGRIEPYQAWWWTFR